MSRVFTFERRVRFDEIDAARILFFARYFVFAHEAMEHFFADADGGYAGLIVDRGVGLPAVDVSASFSAPVRFGDTLRIEVTTAKLGNKSAVLRYRFFRVARGAEAEVQSAEVKHTVVTTALAEMKSVEMPADVRRIFEAHLEG